MSRILLSSQTNFVLEKLPQYTKLNPVSTRVAFFTTAQIPFLQAYPSPKWVEDDFNRWVELGYKVKKLCLNDLEKSNLYEYLQKFDILHFCGGSALYLINSMRESGFDKIVNQLLQNGVIYSGSSAGAMVCCPSMEMKEILDDSPWTTELIEKLQNNLNGLNVCPYLIAPHFDNPNYVPFFMKMVEFKPRPTYPVIFLNNNQAIWSQNGQFELIQN